MKQQPRIRVINHRAADADVQQIAVLLNAVSEKAANAARKMAANRYTSADPREIEKAARNFLMVIDRSFSG